MHPRLRVSQPFSRPAFLASVTIDKAGGVTITGATKITLDAPVIEIKAKSLLSIRSSGAALFTAAATCFIKGALVKIN